MGNYLNPSILTDGIDNLEDRYIGWLLVGEPLVDGDKTITKEGSMPVTDAVIAGIMNPIKVKLSSINENKLTLGNIGYFVYKTDEPTAPLIKNKPSLTDNSELDIISNDAALTEGITKIALDSGTSGQVTLFVRNTNNTSTIFPAGVTSTYKAERYIDIGSGKGKILLALWKDDITHTNEAFGTDLGNKYINDPYTPPSDDEICSKYIDSILFSYDVTASVVQCNDWNYTGFSVGDIEVSLSGLSSN